jgi:hypothetical protein
MHLQVFVARADTNK